MINSDHIKNFFIFLLGIGMFTGVLFTAMHAIDKIADRDCERGIKSACKYVPVQ